LKRISGRETIIVMALLAVLVILFYWKVVFGGFTFVFVDASRFFFPLWKWGAGVLSQGYLPLWNPDAQFGTPYLADPQTAGAYPPLWILYALLGPLNAFAANIILHHLFAILGFWFWAGKLGFSKKAGLFGALAFGFALNLVCSSWTPPALMAISWMPWVFLGTEKLLRAERGGFLVLSFAWAMQLATGYPVLVYLTGLTLGLYLVWKTFFSFDVKKTNIFFACHPEPGRRASSFRAGWFHFFLRNFCLLAVAALVACAYNLVWGLPFLELFQRSNYQSGAEHFQALNFMDLATVLSPFVQGHPLGRDYQGPHYWVSTFFMGLPTLCLVLWGAARLAFKRTAWGLLLVLPVLSLGETLGMAKFLKAFLPGYGLVVHSGFWIPLLVLIAAAMAAEALETVSGLKPSAREKALWIGLAIGVYGASAIIRAPLEPWTFGASFLLLASVLFIRTQALRWVFLALALALSLGWAADSVNILLARSYYEEPPKILAALNKPGRLFFTPPLMTQAVRLEGESMAAAYEAAKQRMYPNWPLAYGRQEAPLYNSLQLKNSFFWTFDAFQYSSAQSRRVLDFLGIRYVFGKNQFKDLRKVSGPGDPVEVFENPTPLFDWFTVEKADAADVSLAEGFRKTKNNPLDYARECFVGDSSNVGFYRTRNVTSRTSGPNRLLVSAQGEGRALVVSSQTAFPGWLVKADGKQRLPEVVNQTFRGVVLEEGETRAEFSFEPVTFRLGLFICLLVCGFWMAMGFGGIFKAKTDLSP
jgi:hypothetical protein